MTLPFNLNVVQLLEGIPHPAIILDKSFQIIAMNRLMEAMTGHTIEEVAGLHGELVIRSNTGNTRSQLYEKVFQEGESLSIKGDILNCYRRKIIVQYTVSLLLDEIDSKCGLLVITEDITSQEKKAATGRRDADSIEIIGYSPKMQHVLDMIPLMSQTDASVMITGETGTGKDMIAEIVHQQSPRSRFPFIKVNCGALPEGLLESELFGHVKGAFTGATRNKPGMFKMADKGTLFLTEIGDMPLPLQVKLLSVLDDRTFVPVGGEQKIGVEVRIVAATHRSLRDQVRKNQFREDLFYRLNVLHVHLPPLREREDDVRYLLDHFLEKFRTPLGKDIVGFASNAMDALLRHRYPGNIRELSNIIEYAVNICKKRKITKEHLPPYLFDNEINKMTYDSPDSYIESDILNDGISNQMRLPLNSDSSGSWAEIEREMIIDTLKKHRGNRTQSAKTLGWGRMKLWRRMKEYGLLK